MTDPPTIHAANATLLDCTPCRDNDTGRREVVLWLDVQGHTVTLALSLDDARQMQDEIDACLEALDEPGDEDQSGPIDLD
jgi:hypothetical protein